MATICSARPFLGRILAYHEAATAGNHLLPLPTVCREESKVVYGLSRRRHYQDTWLGFFEQDLPRVWSLFRIDREWLLGAYRLWRPGKVYVPAGVNRSRCCISNPIGQENCQLRFSKGITALSSLSYFICLSLQHLLFPLLFSCVRLIVVSNMHSSPPPFQSTHFSIRSLYFQQSAGFFLYVSLLFITSQRFCPAWYPLFEGQYLLAYFFCIPDHCVLAVAVVGFTPCILPQKD